VTAPQKRQRAAIYARYSSELQSPRSIDDQVALCRDYCKQNNFAVVGEFHDRALSGASLIGREGVAKLMSFAQAGNCDVVVVECLDRLSRDLGDLPDLWKKLEFAQVQLIAVDLGRADLIQVGIRGLVGALYLKDLAHKVRRGHLGMIREGKRPTGNNYGYRTIAGKPGEREIYGPEAAVVRRIFAEYLTGRTPREIAHGLNKDRIPKTRGRGWTRSAILGDKHRREGILRKDIYRGVIIWNLNAEVKNPATGKHTVRHNAADEWLTVDAPHLRIIDDATWNAAQALIEERALAEPLQQRPVKRLFSGLLVCGVCGAGMVSIGGGRTGRTPNIQCGRFLRSKDCTNSRRFRVDKIEEAVLGQLRRQLAAPGYGDEAIWEYCAAMRRRSTELAQSRSGDERRLDDVKRRMSRLIDQVADGTLAGDMVRDKLAQLEDEARELTARLATTEAGSNVVTLHPKGLEHYLHMLDRLPDVLASGANQEATRLLRATIERIIVYPREPREPTRWEVVGRLSALFAVQPDSISSTYIEGIKPFIQRVRWRSHVPSFSGASSNVAESRIATRWPNRASRTPRSASSVTLNGSHAPASTSDLTRK
jgi:DNA invertase Pin-like site-specific DNA recombinase